MGAEPCRGQEAFQAAAAASAKAPGQECAGVFGWDGRERGKRTWALWVTEGTLASRSEPGGLQPEEGHTPRTVASSCWEQTVRGVGERDAR